MTTQAATRCRYLPDQLTAHLLAAVADDPFAGLLLGVSAPGGYGKTAMLRELARTYRRAGVDVVGVDDMLEGDAAGDPAPGPGRAVARRHDLDAVPAAAVLVDDAHRLDEARLTRLYALAQTPGVRLVVAYRPWPRPRGLAQLTEALQRDRPALLLGQWTVEQVAEFLSDVDDGSRGRGPSEPDEALWAQTGGIPGYVAMLAGQVGDGQLPAGALARFRHDLDLLDLNARLLLLASEAGAGADPELVGALLGCGAGEVGEVADAVRATGLLGRDGTLIPVARRAVAALVPVDQRVAVRRRLAEMQLSRGGPVLNLVAPLLGTGVAGPEAAAIFEAAAAEALPEQPGLSAALYGAAAAAGRPVSFLAARWAEAAALAGDLTTALRLADAVIAGPRRPEQADCALVAAAALAHRGQLDRTAELYQWAGVGPAPAFAAVASIGAGRLVEAPPDIDPGPDVPPPSLLNGAATLMARGLRESVTEPASAALSSLVAACDLLEPVGRAVLLPDSPAALAAVVGVHSGEPATARGVLDRAMGARLGGAVMAARHQLLQAWILMADGETVAARQWLPSGRDTLAARDRLFALAIDVGLARRDSDLAGLRQGWAVACEHLPGHPIDLFSLLPLGELLVTAGRLGEQTRIAGQLDEAWSLLARLGDPPLWTAPLHWSSLHAAVASGRREVAEGHAAALAAGAEQGGRLAGALAAGAESWVALAGGGIDAVRVSAAARLLHDTGLSWDAARLAGQAAIRTPDRDAMVALLECARQLRRRPSRGGGQNGAAADATRSPVLSDREVEVADLVLAGLTYRQIGDRLFISPKTVEHHVARIRQRLGCTSRRDLLTTLRGLGITNAR